MALLIGQVGLDACLHADAVMPLAANARREGDDDEENKKMAAGRGAEHPMVASVPLDAATRRLLIPYSPSLALRLRISISNQAR